MAGDTSLHRGIQLSCECRREHEIGLKLALEQLLQAKLFALPNPVHGTVSVLYIHPNSKKQIKNQKKAYLKAIFMNCC